MADVREFLIHQKNSVTDMIMQTLIFQKATW